MTTHCPICGFTPPKPYEQKPRSIRFIHDGKIETALATVYSDAFYKITNGKFEGNMVHIWDII